MTMLGGAGCATVSWADRPVRIEGHFKKEVVDELLPTVTSQIEEDTDTSFVVVVAVRQGKTLHRKELYRKAQIGRWENGQEAAAGWILGSIVHTFLFGLVAGYILEGDPPDRPSNPELAQRFALVAVAGGGGMAAASGISMLTTVSPPLRRSVGREYRTVEVKKFSVPIRRAEVTLFDSEGGVVVSSTTGSRGEARLELPWQPGLGPLPTGFRLRVRTDGAEVLDRLSIIATSAYLASHQATVAAHVRERRLDDAHAHLKSVEIVPERLGELWGPFCEAVAARFSTDREVDALQGWLEGAPDHAGACGVTRGLALAADIDRAMRPSPPDLDLAASRLASAPGKGPAREAAQAAWCRGALPHARAAVRGARVEAAAKLLDDRSRSCVDVWHELGPVIGRRASRGLSRSRPEEAAAWIGVLEASPGLVSSFLVAELKARLGSLRTELRSKERYAEQRRREREFEQRMASWNGRIRGALRACRNYGRELGRRKSAVLRLAAKRDPRTEDAVMDLQTWIEEQQDGAFGDSLQDMGAIMREMEQAEHEGVDTSARRREFARGAQSSCP
jgi:hypothetical protein